METYYVRSTTGNNSNDGLTRATAKFDLVGAAAVALPGDKVNVSPEHAESTAGELEINFVGTREAPIYVRCVDFGDEPPTAGATGASVTVTGNNPITIQTNGVAYYKGLHFETPNVGGGNAILVAANSGGAAMLDECELVITSGSSGAVLLFGGSTTSQVMLRKTSVKLGGTGQSLAIGGNFSWDVGSFLSGSESPDTVFTQSTPGVSKIRNVDLSSISPTYICSAEQRCEDLDKCNLPVAVLTSATPAPGNYACALGADYFSFAGPGGTIDAEFTVVRTGGASDGVTPVSLKMVTNAFVTWEQPLSSPPIEFFNPTTGADVDVTERGTWDGGSVPNNDDIWIEVGYFGAAGNSLGTLDVSNTKADIFASSSPQSSDASTWGGGTTPFKMVTTLSAPQPAQIGPMYVVVKAAKPSTTFYADWKRT